MLRKEKSRMTVLTATLLPLLLGSGCHSSSKTEATRALTDKIGGVGSAFVDPLMKRWILGFEQTHPQLGVNYRAEGSGAGIAEIKRSMTEFAASDAPLSDEELKTIPTLLQVPVTAGPVCIIYNLPALKTPVKLDGKTLADIFLGRVVTWNDPAIIRSNPGVNLPKASIIVAHRSDGSGTTSILTTYLAKVSPDWAKKPGTGISVDWPVGLRGKGSTGVIDLVKQASGAIGYAEVSYAKKEDLSVASIENRAGTYIEPSVAGASAALADATEALAKDVRTPIVDPSASAKDAYPISGVTFLLIPKDGTNELDRKTLKAFAEYAVTDGQAATEGLYYAKLPRALQEGNLRLISTMTTNGQPTK